MEEDRSAGDDLPFEGLDFLYMPSPDVARDLAFYTDILGGEVVFSRAPEVIGLLRYRGARRIVLGGRFESDRRADRRDARGQAGAVREADPGGPR